MKQKLQALIYDANRNEIFYSHFLDETDFVSGYPDEY